MDTTNPADIRHVVVLGHPAGRSFNRAVAEAYVEAVRECGQEAVLRDLYAIGFDPVLKAEERPGPACVIAPEIEAELEIIRESQVVALVYPLWFGMPPAIIKGYIDRVLGSGFAARQIKSGEAHRLLAGKRLTSLSSSSTSLPWLGEHGQWMSLRQGIDDYLTTIFSMRDAGHVHFDEIVDHLAPHWVDENLERVREHARGICAAVLHDSHARYVHKLQRV